MCTVGVDPHSLPYSQFSYGEGKTRGGEGRDLAWPGDCRLPLCFLFVRTERSYGSKVDD